MCCGLAIYIKKYVKQGKRRRIMETQIFHHAKKYNLQTLNLNPKKPLGNKNQNPSRYYNSITKSQVFQYQPKYIIFQKSSYKNRPIIIIIIIT